MADLLSQEEIDCLLAGLDNVGGSNHSHHSNPEPVIDWTDFNPAWDQGLPLEVPDWDAQDTGKEEAPTVGKTGSESFAGSETVLFEVELLKGGACARLLRLVSRAGGEPARMLLWSLAIGVRFPVFISSPSGGCFGGRIFDEDETGEAITDGFLEGEWKSVCTLAAAHLGHDHAAAEFKQRSHQWFREIQGHLRSQLLPSVVSIATTFGDWESLRWSIYTWIAEDPTGRIGQIAEVCPGVLLLAGYLNFIRANNDLSLLLSFVTSGMKLGLVLDLCMEIWKSLERGNTRFERVAAMRARLARVGRLVPPPVLVEYPGGEVVREDIPSDPHENQAWFMVQDLFCRTGDPRLSSAARAGLGAFLSRHGVEFLRLARARGRHEAAFPDPRSSFRFTIRCLVDYLSATGRRPGRESDPARVMEEQERWHEREVYLRIQHLIGSSGRPLRPEQPLSLGPAGNFPLWKMGPHVIRFIPTVEALRMESETMRHCIASYASLAVDGARQIFHGVINGQDVTIEICFQGKTPTWRQAAGKSNQPLDGTAKNIIGLWLADLTAAISAETSGVAPLLKGHFEEQAARR